MVLRSFPLMVHAWENGAKQALSRKCRDARRAMPNEDDDEDDDQEEPRQDEDRDQEPRDQQRRDQELRDQARHRRLARQFIDDEAIEDNDLTDDKLPVLLTPPYQLTPTQTQDYF